MKHTFKTTRKQNRIVCALEGLIAEIADGYTIGYSLMTNPIGDRVINTFVTIERHDDAAVFARLYFEKNKIEIINFNAQESTLISAAVLAIDHSVKVVIK